MACAGLCAAGLQSGAGIAADGVVVFRDGPRLEYRLGQCHSRLFIFVRIGPAFCIECRFALAIACH